MTSDHPVEAYLMDMDGVLVHEEQLVPGADQFVKRLQETGHPFLVLTNLPSRIVDSVADLVPTIGARRGQNGWPPSRRRSAEPRPPAGPHGT